MGRRLPSLNALKAAARLESFTEAAGEMFVTHAAVSRHVRDLEEWLGTQLFIRTGRGVELTEPGRRFVSRLTPLFDQLADATREAAAVGDVRQLKVTVEPAVASRWLVPRLGRFNDLHPISNWPSTPPRSLPISAPARPMSASAMALAPGPMSRPSS
jgi:LysR family glycine cleavage system transcriptional activator